ncbi:DUF6383 domain-containing protein [Parabacteroides gordonii]|uniref:DUF6383 domain-containing protein n=1 Tax=Parabacteroides gordonii MS-1 = DSM 23371 TaxID=1203610 RepID=A0A0F5JLJ3_9BACT|nr:DUF6383 domain-containing protein [Parabacteroides gordonii]KKB58317.1 hypothetical protein HMPREF1536_01192 [Parabacteroides gordonii MS-1 = DSM 23371]MCA5583411.1 DUF6383 domain-containing protein [Parabacteroides gordonii]
MNKKFSTLVAVLLAAGAWTTLDAKVVVTPTPVANSAYAIGSSLNEKSAQTLGLSTFYDAEDAVNEVSVVAGEGGLNFGSVSSDAKWQFIGTISSSAVLQVTIKGTPYYLCYDGSVFSLSTSEDDSNVLHVKDAAAGITIVGGKYNNKFLSVTSSGLSVVDGTPALAVTATGGAAALGSLSASTLYVFSSAANLADGGTYYLKGAFSAAVPAYYDLLKTGAAEITDASKDIWTVVAGSDEGQFKLKTVVEGVDYFIVADGTNPLVASNVAAVAATEFELVKGELVAVEGGKELAWSEGVSMAEATPTNYDNAIQFGKYEQDVEVSVPGYEDLTQDENGAIIVKPNADIDAPLYVAVGETYLSVDADGNVVESETPSLGLGSAWGVENGVFYSIAAKKADPKNTKIYLVAKPKVGYSLSTTYALGEKTVNPVATADVTATVNTTVPVTDLVDNISILSQSVARVSSIDKDEYVFVALNTDGTAGSVTVLSKTGASAALVSIEEAQLDDYLWKVTETKNKLGKYYYTFENKATKALWSVDGNNTEFYATGQYANKVDLYLSNNGKTIGAGFAAAEPAVAISLYSSPLIGRTNTYLKDLKGDGFNMTIKMSKDSKAEVEYMDAFAGKLVPQGSKDAKQFQIKSGDKFLVLNTTKLTNITGVNGAFELVDAVDAKDHLSYFQVNYLYGGKDADRVAELLVAKAADMVNATKAFIVATPDANYLTTKKTLTEQETLPYITLGEDNIYSVKNLLGKFWNISYAETKEAAKEQSEEYKLNGVLVPTNEYAQSEAAKDVADYVDAGTVLLSSPETQWAVVEADLATNKFTLQNRETGVTVKDIVLRATDTKDVYSVTNVATGAAIEGDLIKVTAVAEVKKFDGYKRAEVNTLRNQVFNIGQFHNATGNVDAYWAENHQTNGTHQLGIVTEGAVDWRLSLDTKSDAKKKTEVDTVYVITKMATLKDGKILTGDAEGVKADTLAILPYLFQNKSNLEYVKFKAEGFNYYVCDETPDVKDNGTRFALKVKPNGYNIVVLPEAGGVKTSVGTDKVFAGNSVQWGALSNMNTYAKDDNSIMVVEEVDKPEYRKVVKEWGDIVKIFRQEYPTEALFEKRDAKSVVEKDTLSFLNVNNSVSGANPALFIDTAYVNRVDADGIANTCYQYLLGVNVDKDDTYYCPYNPEHNSQEWRDEHNNGKPCADAMEHKAVKGRFLINLIDTANVYGATHLHNNPYVNGVEAGEKLAKLSFVEGIHANDTLYITRKGGEVVKLAMDSPEFNVAKFAFRYVNNADGSFKIQTRYKNYNPAATQKQIEDAATNDGYLKWINGTVVVTEKFINGETFNMEENYDGQAVANEDVTVSSISVIAKEGAVTINGAAGKKVVITNVLGQTIASTVLSSDNATIAAPAGIVVVAVEGEAAVKAIVK